MTRSCAVPSPATERPRTTAAGTPLVFPSTSSAAPAISSATAISVDRSSYPAASRSPRRSSSVTIPAEPSATSVVPPRQGRPHEARVLAAGELDRARRRLQLVEPHDAALGLRDRLLGNDDDVAVLQPADPP